MTIKPGDPVRGTDWPHDMPSGTAQSIDGETVRVTFEGYPRLVAYYLAGNLRREGTLNEPNSERTYPMPELTAYEVNMLIMGLRTADQNLEELAPSLPIKVSNAEVRRMISDSRRLQRKLRSCLPRIPTTGLDQPPQTA